MFSKNTLLLTIALLPAAALASDRTVNVRDFEDSVVEGDWSRAIQAAIDSVNENNGYDAGGTVLFPAGTYPVSRSIVVGEKPAHWGLRLIGYGATLVGTKALDEQQLVDPEPEEADKGVPILILKHPQGNEGASYTIEGLRFTREQRLAGVAISVPWKEVPKNVTFRSLKIHGQNVGVHINYAWQFSFQDCLFRANGVGMIIQNHGNNIGIVNCAFRRQHHHGLEIGPDRGQTASNGYHISGSIFEANKGYGVVLHSAAQIRITGNYFEANGNSIGVFTPYGEVTIDTNFFWGSYGHGWQRNRYSDQAHIVLANTKRVQLRNNHYAAVKAYFRRQHGKNLWAYVPYPKGPSGVPNEQVKRPTPEDGYDYEERPSAIFIAGGLGEDIVLDALPVVHHEALDSGLRAASHADLSYYQYNVLTNTFEEISLVAESDEEATARRRRTRQGLAERMEVTDSTDDRAWLQIKIGRTWLAESDYERAREEYRKALAIPAPGQTHLRAALTIEIAKSYMDEGKYLEAAAAYKRALDIGPGGWRLQFARDELAKAQAKSK